MQDAGCKQLSNYLTNFAPVTEEDVGKFIMHSASKSCCLDPVPTQIVKQCLDTLPIITLIINLSLSSLTVPTFFKIAAVAPPLKKAILIADILKNCHPISNLPFLSKVLDKVATKRLLLHKDINDLHELMQSTHWQHHSTETPLLCVQNALLRSLGSYGGDQSICSIWYCKSQYSSASTARVLQDQRKCTCMAVVLPYWQEAIHHNKRGKIWRTGKVLWCSSWIDPLQSLYCFFSGWHLLQKYADDTQICLPFSPGKEGIAITELEQYLGEVREGMGTNWLQLNESESLSFFDQQRTYCLWREFQSPLVSVLPPSLIHRKD